MPISAGDAATRRGVRPGAPPPYRPVTNTYEAHRHMIADLSRLFGRRRGRLPAWNPRRALSVTVDAHLMMLFGFEEAAPRFLLATPENRTPTRPERSCCSRRCRPRRQRRTTLIRGFNLVASSGAFKLIVSLPLTLERPPGAVHDSRTFSSLSNRPSATRCRWETPAFKTFLPTSDRLSPHIVRPAPGANFLPARLELFDARPCG